MSLAHLTLATRDVPKLLADVELTLGLAGCASCADVSRDNLSRECS